MKQKTHHLYYLFYPRGWIIIALLLFIAAATAQEQTPPPDEFPVGTQIGPESFINIPAIREALDSSGLNTIYQLADNDRKGLLAGYNLIATNVRNKDDYISYYTTCFYSKWEAEQNLTGEDTARVGFKHKAGNPANWKGKQCWSTEGLSVPACSLMYGPHYRQEKRYKRLYNTELWGIDTVQYVVRFNMALSNPQSVPDNEDVCKIKVVFRYKDMRDSTHYDVEFKSRILKISDFNPDSTFKDIYLHENPDSNWYQYPDSFIVPRNADKIINPSAETFNYVDYESYTGIQYWVEWLRNDNKCNLYIDYVELYDNDGWNVFMGDSSIAAQAIQDIKNYADSFKTMGWDNIIYWAGVDEPYIIDSYMPIHIVDSLIRSVQAPPISTPFNPTWTWDHKVNGEDQMAQYYNIAKPSRLNVSINPCSENWPRIRAADYEWMKFNFQRASELDSNFWYNAQTHGYLADTTTREWCVWRKPDSAELKSMVMLALAYGAKGIMFFWFESFPWVEDRASCVSIYIEAIVDEEGNPLDLYWTIKDTLVPRLKGALGKKLLTLKYTGDNLALRRHITGPNEPPNTGSTVSEEYLTLSEYAGETPPPPVNFHAGFFSRPGHPLDKYFMLDNLITTNERRVIVKVENDCSSHPNNRFRNIEGKFDTTFSCECSVEMLFPPGEGYLFQVAPVIKYGGRLLYSEATQPGMILEDDMVIENGAVLTINGVYSAKGNITVKSGGIINGSNGKIQFVAGKKLIIEGSATISSTTGSNLHLLFTPSQDDDPTGIMIKAGGSLTISNCKIENANIGIESLLNANRLTAHNVEFINCKDYSISIAGRSPGMNPAPPRRYLAA